MLFNNKSSCLNCDASFGDIDEIVEDHLPGLRQPHDVKDAGRDIGQAFSVDNEFRIVSDIDDGHLIQRMGCVERYSQYDRMDTLQW